MYLDLIKFNEGDFMRAVVQRVKKACVVVNGEVISKIENGICCFIGIKNDDDVDDLNYIKDKIIKLRIFEDENFNMNKSIEDVSGEILLISQFTLYGDVRRGTRPSFTEAMKREDAKKFFDEFVEKVKSSCDVNVETGSFGDDMKIEVINDGPVTILLDSERKF